MLPNLEQGKRLVALARHAIETFFSNEGLNLDSYKEEFAENHGVFVQIIKGENEARQCLGYADPTYPLYRGIVKAARAAAFENKSCPSLTKEEIPNIRIKVAVITTPQLLRVMNPQDYFKLIRIGVDGIMVRSGVYSAISLPDVPLKYFWDVERFLRYVCQEAGLTMDAWMSTTAQVYKFQARSFEERDGQIVEI